MLYTFAKSILKPFLYIFFRPRVEGLHHIPSEGKVILYSNHISMWDPIVVGCFLPRRIYFMAKAELFKNPLLGWLVRHLGAFPVKRGTADLSAIKNALQVLKDGKVFGIFPEGTRSKTGEVQNFSHGVASIAHKSKARIIPIGITNGYRIFKSMTIRVGEPLEFEQYFTEKSNTELLEEMSEKMSEALRELVENGKS